MENYGRQKRKTEVTTKYKDGYTQGDTGGLGKTEKFGYEYGDDTLGVGGENSSWKFGSLLKSISHSFGGIISQLIQEAQQQLAYHEEQIEHHQQQAEILKTKIKQLDEVYYQLKLNQ